MSVITNHREDLPIGELKGRPINKIAFAADSSKIPNFRNYRRVRGTMYADLDTGTFVLIEKDSL